MNLAEVTVFPVAFSHAFLFSAVMPKVYLFNFTVVSAPLATLKLVILEAAVGNSITVSSPSALTKVKIKPSV